MVKKRIKILYVETYTHVAGGQKGLLDLVSHLDQSEFEPVVLLQGPGRLKDGLDRLRVKTVTKRLEPFKNRWLPFSWKIGVGPVKRVLESEKPDLVHSNHLYAGRYSGRAAKSLGIPSLVTLRIVQTPEVFDRHNRVETLLAHDRVISNSDEGRLTLLSLPGVKARISTIKNGIDLSRFRPVDKAAAKAELARIHGFPASDLLITQVASRVPQKGNEELMRAFLDLLPRFPSLRLFLVGGPFAGTDNKGKLLEMAKTQGLEGRVHLTDFVSDVTAFLNAADISVLASREREGLPRSIIEAMACGNPVIGTDVGGMKELIEDGVNGRLLPPGDPESLRSALEELLTDAGKRRSYGEAGLAKARASHDIRVMMERYQALYRELAA